MLNDPGYDDSYRETETANGLVKHATSLIEVGPTKSVPRLTVVVRPSAE